MTLDLDMTESLAPKSDQLDAIDLVARAAHVHHRERQQAQR